MRDEVAETVRLLAVPGGVVELRAIADNGTHSGYFNDPEILATSAELLDLATVHGVYITLNEVPSALLARRANRVKMRLGAKDATTSDADIRQRRWFPIDIDPVRPSGVSATDEERDLAFQKAHVICTWLEEHGFPRPLQGDSGNGAHLLYRIDLRNDEQSKRLVQQCLSVLHLFFSDERCTVDTAVFNAARIWKLYGTVSRKGDHTPERPHRRSHLVSVPDPLEVVPVETLEQLAGLLPTGDSAPGASAGVLSGGIDPGTSGSNPGSTRFGSPLDPRGSSPAGYGAGLRDPNPDGTSPSRTGLSPPGSNRGPAFRPGFSRAEMSAGTPGTAPNRTKVYPDGIVPLNLTGWLREHGIVVRYEKPWQGGRLFVLDECPFSSAHRDGAFAIQFPNGAVYAGSKHASCGGGTQRWLELRRMFDQEFVEREKERELNALTGEQPAGAMTGGIPPGTRPMAGNRSGTTSSGMNTNGGNGTDAVSQAPAKKGTESTPMVGFSIVGDTTDLANAKKGTGSSPIVGFAIVGDTTDLANAKKGAGSSPIVGGEASLPPIPGKGSGPGSPARDQAIGILRSGDPRAFILDTFAKCHVGDEIVAACYLASILSSSVRNSRGLHVCPTGDSGKGKSDSADAFLWLLPDDAKLQGSITSKALFYHEIDPGSAIIFDDFSMSEDLREVLKNATSKFQHSLRHYTLNANRQPVILELPERCVWWILSVDNPGDDQVLNRMMNPWIDDTEQQDMRVRDRIFAEAGRSGGAPEENEDVAVCREIFSLVREQMYTVCIPFSTRIRMDSIRNRRNPIMLLDIIRSFAALRFMQREQRVLPDGTMEIDATTADFDDAARLFSALDSTFGGQTSKLLKNEKLLIDSVIAMKSGEFTVKDIQSWMGLSHVVIRRIIHGRPERDGDTGGLLSKCPALGVTDTTVSEGTIAAITRRRENHYFFDYERYKRWNRSNGVWLSPEDHDPDNEEGPDPKDPTWDRVGISNGIESNSSENGQNGDQSDNSSNSSTISTSRSQERESAASSVNPEISQPSAGPSGVCSRETGSWDHENENIPGNGENEIKSQENGNLVIPDSIPDDPSLGSWDHIRERDYVAIPQESSEPCHVCGRSPTSSIRVRSLEDLPGSPGKYLCSTCLKQAKEREKELKRLNSVVKIDPPPIGISPLPGLLDPGDFIRVKFSLGKCDVCGGKDAVFRSASKAMNCCEKCFGRLVREGNRAEGVG